MGGRCRGSWASGRRVILTHDLTGTGLKGLVMCLFVGCYEYISKFGFCKKWRIF